MITFPGWMSPWHSPSPWLLKAVDQREGGGGDGLWHDVAREPEGGGHPAAQRKGLRRRRHPVNGQAERRKDGARPSERHGAAARGLQQGRSVEAAEHDAEAAVERHLAEHLRAGAPAAKTAGRSAPPAAEPRRETFLEQFYDLTWRPGVDVRLLPWSSPLPRDPRIARPPAGRDQTPTAGKENARDPGCQP